MKLINQYLKFMWIAREENEDLYLFRHKPYKNHTYWYSDNENAKEDRIRIDRDLFPEITYYNSPKEVVLQIKEDLNTNI
jgi:hypothetical protein